MQNFGNVIGGSVYAYLSQIRDQEAQHVKMLQSMITSLGGTPVKPCTYSFSFKTADDFAALAALIENTGVMAYGGVLYQIQNLSVKTAAATIATVEGRHASYLNLLNRDVSLLSFILDHPPELRLRFWLRSPNIQRRANR